MRTLSNVDFHSDTYQTLKEYITSKNIQCHSEGIHFGNDCLINIPNDLISDILAFPQTTVRNIKTIIEKEDLEQYKEGDRIIIEYLETDFFPVRDAKGTVDKIRHYQIGDKKYTELAVRAYKHKTRGYFVRTGDNCKISKGWKANVKIQEWGRMQKR